MTTACGWSSFTKSNYYSCKDCTFSTAVFSFATKRCTWNNINYKLRSYHLPMMKLIFLLNSTFRWSWHKKFSSTISFSIPAVSEGWALKILIKTRIWPERNFLHYHQLMRSFRFWSSTFFLWSILFAFPSSFHSCACDCLKNMNLFLENDKTCWERTCSVKGKSNV